MGGKHSGRSDGVVADHSVVRVVGESWKGRAKSRGGCLLLSYLQMIETHNKLLVYSKNTRQSLPCFIKKKKKNRKQKKWLSAFSAKKKGRILHLDCIFSPFMMDDFEVIIYQAFF